MMQATIFHCNEDIHWVKEFDKIVLISLEQNLAYVLEGTDAVIWEYLTLQYGSAQLIAHLSALLDISTDAANNTMIKTLIAWEQKGLIKKEKVI